MKGAVFWGEKYVFLCFLTTLQSEFINIGNLKFLISLLKQVSCEDIGWKSWLILIVSISFIMLLDYGLEKKGGAAAAG
jgi:hypothetical protein